MVAINPSVPIISRSSAEAAQLVQDNPEPDPMAKFEGANPFDFFSSPPTDAERERIRIEAERLEAARNIAKAKAEEVRAEAERVKKELLAIKEEANRVAAAEKAEQDRMEQDRIEQERIEKNRAAADERIEQERLESERTKQKEVAHIEAIRTAEEEKSKQEHFEAERLAAAFAEIGPADSPAALDVKQEQEPRKAPEIENINQWEPVEFGWSVGSRHFLGENFRSLASPIETAFGHNFFLRLHLGGSRVETELRVGDIYADLVLRNMEIYIQIRDENGRRVVAHASDLENGACASDDPNSFGHCPFVFLNEAGMVVEAPRQMLLRQASSGGLRVKGYFEVGVY